MLQPLAAQKRGKTFGLRSLGATFFAQARYKRTEKAGPNLSSFRGLHLVTFHSNVAGVSQPPALEDFCGGWVAESHLVAGGKSLRKKEATSVTGPLVFLPEKKIADFCHDGFFF